MPQNARTFLFSNQAKLTTFAAAPLVLTPFVRNQNDNDNATTTTTTTTTNSNNNDNDNTDNDDDNNHIYIYIHTGVHCGEAVAVPSAAHLRLRVGGEAGGSTSLLKTYSYT